MNNEIVFFIFVVGLLSMVLIAWKIRASDSDFRYSLFEPKEDITAYELAIIMRARHTTGNPQWVENQAPEIRRHFRIVSSKDLKSD